jgi:hypothetical protein
VALPAALARLQRELGVIAEHLRAFAAGKASVSDSNHFTFLDECLLEGLISRVWQEWCQFGRSCLIGSCMGSTTARGLAINGLRDATSEHHVSGAAVRAKKQPNPPYWGAPNTTLRIEPTWGDVDMFVRIVGRLQPANATQLQAAFSSGHASAKALQFIRNGSAHNHQENMNDIQALRSAYIVFPIGHPTHALFWVHPASSDFLIIHAIEDLLDTASAAIT